MKGNSIKGSVIKRGKRLFLFILPISPLKSMTKKFGGVMNGHLLTMERLLTLREDFLINFENSFIRYHFRVSSIPIVKMLSIQIIVLTTKTVICVLMLAIAIIVITALTTISIVVTV